MRSGGEKTSEKRVDTYRAPDYFHAPLRRGEAHQGESRNWLGEKKSPEGLKKQLDPVKGIS